MKNSFRILFISIFTILISIIGINAKAYDYPKAGFISGTSFNEKVTNMANAIDQDKGLEIIKHVVHADSMPENVNAEDVSYIGGNNQGNIYIWITDDTLYYWSNAEVIEANIDANDMFKNFTKVEDIEIDFTGANTTNTSSMFQNCSSLKTLDFSNFDTSYVTNMTSMFSGCSSLTSIKFGLLDTHSVTDMTSMFDNCSSLTSLDLSNFNTSRVTNMTAMFNQCTSLTDLNLSSFNTSNVTNMTAMFNGLSSIEEIDIRSFSSNSIENAYAMFTSCPNLKTIYATNSFDLTNLSSATIFGGSINLVGDKGTEYIIENEQHTRISNEFAHLDGGESNPGYFSTEKTKVTVTYMSEGNVFDTKELMIYDRIPLLEGEAVPTKQGYTFAYWCTDSELNNQFDFDTRIRENTTLYAKFVKNITFNIVSEHGSVVIKDKKGEDITTQGIAPGEVMYITVTPNTGYRFTKMNISGINGTTIEYMEPTTQNYIIDHYDELTLTATYTELPKITLGVPMHPDGSIPGSIEMTDTNTGEVIVDNHFDAVRDITFTAKPEAGFTFSKFVILGQERNVLFDNITNNPYTYQYNPTMGDLTVEAYFNDVRHQVYFKRGNDIAYVTRVANGEKIKSTEVPTTADLNNYTVNGWYHDENLTQPFDFENEVITEDTNIYGDITANSSYLYDGSNFNLAIKLVAGNNIEYEDILNHNDTALDKNIKRIVKASEKPSLDNCSAVSPQINIDGNGPFLPSPATYVCYENETIYYWSEAEKIFVDNDASNMFWGLSSVESIDATGFDTSQTMNMSSMFAMDDKLTSLDLSTFTRESLETVTGMFYGDSSLKTIFATSNFDISDIQDPKMFNNCTSLVGMLGTEYNQEYEDNSRGHLDGGENNPGYFSENVKVKLTYMIGDEKFYETEVLKGSMSDINTTPSTDEKHYFNGWYYHYDNGQYTGMVLSDTRFVEDTVIYGFIDENLKINVIPSPYGEIIVKVGENVIDPNNGVAPETLITVLVEPKDTHTFVNLLFDGDPVQEMTLEMNVWADITLEAVYEEKPVITIPNDDNLNGKVTIKDSSGEEITNGHADIGQIITIDVEPDENYKVDKVIIKDKDGHETEITPDQLPYNLAVTGDVEISIEITELPVINIDDNEENQNGTVTIVDETGKEVKTGDHIEPGTTITINVEPKDGYKVVGVEIVDPETGEVIDTLEGEPPYEYVVNGPIKVKPIYEKLPEITIPENEEGSHGEVTITDPNGNPIDGYVEPGTVVTIDVTPEDGYEVEKVIITKEDGTKVEVDGKDLPYNLVVTGDIDIEPVYREKPTINLPKEENDNGTVKVTDKDGKEIKNGDNIGTGEEITIDVEPKDNYEVDKVIIKDKDGNVIEEISGKELPKKYTVNGPITLEVTYKFIYKILSGDNQTYVKGSKQDIVIKSNGELDELKNVEIDNGNVIDPSNYELASGSTILTLKASFLEESSVGKHTITFNYKDGGSVSATLNVTNKDTSPKTGDNIILYVLMFISSLIILWTSYVYLRKRLSN